jgi:hypothetical protein
MFISLTQYREHARTLTSCNKRNPIVVGKMNSLKSIIFPHTAPFERVYAPNKFGFHLPFLFAVYVIFTFLLHILHNIYKMLDYDRGTLLLTLNSSPSIINY